MTVLVRHLSLPEVLDRIHARSAAEVARHNASVIDLGERRSRRIEVLEIFAEARRLGR